MSGNNCDKKNKKSNLGGGVPGLVGNGGHGGRSRGAGSSQDRFRLRNGFGQYQFLVNAGMYVISKKLLKLLKTEEWCDMPELFQRGLNLEYKMHTHLMNNEWTDIGRIAEYKALA